MQNNYPNRIRASGWISALLHAFAFLLAWWCVPAIHFGSAKQPSDTIEVSLLPPTPEPPAERPLDRQLIDVAAPATAPVQPTDLIAIQNSNAADKNAESGDKPGPKVDVEDDIDSLGGRAGSVPMPQAPQPAETPAPAPKEDEPADAAAPEDKIEAAITSEAKVPEKSAAKTPLTVAKAQPSAPAEAAAAPAPPVSAAAAPSAEQPGNNQPADAQTRGRKYRGVRNVGVQGFEALQDQIAPYLKKVEDAVERRWREALFTKYNGSRATEAQIDCEIGPDGTIVSLKITGTPDDRIYAALCKEAIEKAGPFGPFPFKVPEIYRNRNLEIRWSFNFS